jgi:hypothetical protein
MSFITEGFAGRAPSVDADLPPDSTSRRGSPS